MDNEPDAVLLLVGTNNLANESLIVKDMKDCSTLLKLVNESFPSIPVYMCAVLPRLDSFNYLVKYFNTQMAKCTM